MSQDLAILPVSEKYPPEYLDQCHTAQRNTLRLKKIISKTTINQGIPNILLCGPRGSGKYVRALAVLNEFFKDLNYQTIRNCTVRAIDIESGSFCPIPGTAGTKKTEKAVLVLTSPVHCEIDMDQSNADKSLINFLEYYSKTKNIAMNCHKYVVIRHAERIRFKTQHSLRMVMERKSQSIRFIVLCRSLNNWILPLRSRFIHFSIPAPSIEEAKLILRDVGNKEGWKLTKKREDLIIQESLEGLSRNINIGTLLMVMEGSFLITKKLFKVYTPLRKMATQNLYRALMEGDREKILEVLGEIYLQDHIEFREIIMKDLLAMLLDEVTEDKKYKLVQIASEWDHRIADDNIFYPLLVAEAYLLEVVECVSRH